MPRAAENWGSRWQKYSAPLPSGGPSLQSRLQNAVPGCEALVSAHQGKPQQAGGAESLPSWAGSSRQQQPWFPALGEPGRAWRCAFTSFQSRLSAEMCAAGGAGIPWTHRSCLLEQQGEQSHPRSEGISRFPGSGAVPSGGSCCRCSAKIPFRLLRQGCRCARLNSPRRVLGDALGL